MILGSKWRLILVVVWGVFSLLAGAAHADKPLVSPLILKAQALQKSLNSVQTRFAILQQQRGQVLSAIGKSYFNQYVQQKAKALAHSQVYLNECDRLMAEIREQLSLLAAFNYYNIADYGKKLSGSDAWQKVINDKKTSSWNQALPLLAQSYELAQFEKTLILLEYKIKIAQENINAFNRETLLAAQNYATEVKQASKELAVYSGGAVVGGLAGAALGAGLGIGSVGVQTLKLGYAGVGLLAADEKLQSSKKSALVKPVKVDDSLADLNLKSTFQDDQPEIDLNELKHTTKIKIGSGFAGDNSKSTQVIIERPAKKNGKNNLASAQKPTPHSSLQNSFTAQLPKINSDELKLESMTAEEAGPAKVPSKQALLELAQEQLKAVKNLQPGFSKAALVEFLVAYEVSLSSSKPSQFAYLKIQKNWQQKIAEYQGELAAMADASVEKKIEALMQWLHRDYLNKYRLPQAQVIPALRGMGANCEAQTKIIIGALQATGLSDQLPSDTVVGAELFDDHIQPVLFNQSLGTKLNLVTLKKYDGLAGSLYRPEIIYHAVLKAEGLNPVLTARDLLIAQNESLASIPDVLKWQSGRFDTNTNLDYPKVGKNFASPGRAPTEFALMKKPEFSQQLHKSFNDHQGAQAEGSAGEGDNGSGLVGASTNNFEDVVNDPVVSTMKLGLYNQKNFFYSNENTVLANNPHLKVVTSTQRIFFREARDRQHFMKLPTVEAKLAFLSELNYQSYRDLYDSTAFSKIYQVLKDLNQIKKYKFSDAEKDTVLELLRFNSRFAESIANFDQSLMNANVASSKMITLPEQELNQEAKRLLKQLKQLAVSVNSNLKMSAEFINDLSLEEKRLFFYLYRESSQVNNYPREKARLLPQYLSNSDSYFWNEDVAKQSKSEAKLQQPSSLSFEPVKKTNLEGEATKQPVAISEVEIDLNINESSGEPENKQLNSLTLASPEKYYETMIVLYNEFAQGHIDRVMAYNSWKDLLVVLVKRKKLSQEMLEYFGSSYDLFTVLQEFENMNKWQQPAMIKNPDGQLVYHKETAQFLLMILKSVPESKLNQAITGQIRLQYNSVDAYIKYLEQAAK